MGKDVWGRHFRNCRASNDATPPIGASVRSDEVVVLVVVLVAARLRRKSDIDYDVTTTMLFGNLGQALGGPDSLLRHQIHGTYRDEDGVWSPHLGVWTMAERTGRDLLDWESGIDCRAPYHTTHNGRKCARNSCNGTIKDKAIMGVPYLSLLHC
jgi:hypothetical protein